MTIQQEQPRGDIEDIADATGAESIKLTKNTKGYNWSIRVVVQEGENLHEALQRLRSIDSAVADIYGMG